MADFAQSAANLENGIAVLKVELLNSSASNPSWKPQGPLKEAVPGS
jgi:hypothetical protein